MYAIDLLLANHRCYAIFVVCNDVIFVATPTTKTPTTVAPTNPSK